MQTNGLKIPSVTVVLLLAVIFWNAGPPAISFAAWNYKGPAGVAVESLSCDPSVAGTVYIGTPGGIYKTTNGGNTWAYQGFRAFARASPSTPGRVGSPGDPRWDRWERVPFPWRRPNV